MTRYESGTIAWAADPLKQREERPVVILWHKAHPFGATDCTIMCMGTDGGNYDDLTPAVKEEHVKAIDFANQTYLFPWALHTIPPATIRTERAIGHLTDEGEKLVKKALIRGFHLD
jgi:hypothetical protein